MYLTHALRAILRTAVATGDALWKYVSLLLSGTPPTQTFIADASVNAHVLTLNGDVRPSNLNPYVEGYYSNFFDGTGDYLSAPSNAVFGMSTDDFTWEAWVYPTQIANGSGIISIGSVELYIRNSAGGNTVAYYDGSTVVVTSASAVTANQWSHVALVRSSGNLKIYLNGVGGTGVSYSSSVGSNSTCYIGVYSNLSSDIFTGYISNLRILKGTAVYTANFTPPTAPLTAIANTSLLTCQSNRFIDNSANNFAITRTGDVAVRGFVPFTPPTTVNVNTLYSTYFDGTGDYLSAPDDVAFTMGSGDFTIECWINLSTLSGSQMVIGTADAPGNQGSMSFVLNVNSGTPRIGVGYGNAVYYATAASTITANTWVHLAGVRNGASVYIYVNGVQSTALNMASLAINDSTQIVAVGRNGNYNGEYVTGYISNVRIVKGTAVYTSNFTPSTTPLTAISGTSLLTCQSATHIDNSSNAFAITTTGDACARTQNPFGFTNTTTGTAYTPALYGGSAYFDGSGDYLQIADNVALQMGTGSFSIEFWINFTSIASYQTIFSKGYSNAGSLLIQTNTGTGRPVLYSGGSLLLACTGSAATANTWIHYALVRNGTTLTWYTDGVVTGTTTNSTNIYNAEAVVIGTHGGLTYFLNGYLSDLRITKGQALYTGGFVPPIAPLQAVKNTVLLLNMDKSGITDSSRCVDLETVGDAKIRYESPYSGSYYSNYFDGTGDYLIVPNNTAFAFGSGNFTVEMWVSLSSASGTVVNYSNGQSTNSNFAWELYQLNSSTVMFSIFEGATQYISSSAAFALNQWNHIACVRNGNTLTTYVNGVAGGTTVNVAGVTISAPANASVNICSYLNGSYNPAGHISNFRIVKGTALYTANFTPPTAPLTAVAGTSLLTCQSKSFVDNSSNNFTITRNGDVAVRSLNPFQANIANSSMYFDGSGDYLVSTNTPALYLGTSNFTIEFWVYGLNFSAGPNIIRGTAQYSIGILGSASSLIYYISGNGTTWNIASGVSMGSIVSSCWNHVALVRNGSTFTPYINGVAGTTTTSAVAIAQTNGFYVGAEASGPGAGPFQGYVADLRVTNGAARYTTNFTPPTAPLPTS